VNKPIRKRQPPARSEQPEASWLTTTSTLSAGSPVFVTSPSMTRMRSPRPTRAVSSAAPRTRTSEKPPPDSSPQIMKRTPTDCRSTNLPSRGLMMRGPVEPSNRHEGSCENWIDCVRSDGCSVDIGVASFRGAMDLKLALLTKWADHIERLVTPEGVKVLR
jgi:hypothetical protein